MNLMKIKLNNGNQENITEVGNHIMVVGDHITEVGSHMDVAQVDGAVQVGAQVVFGAQDGVVQVVDHNLIGIGIAIINQTGENIKKK